MCIRDSCSFWEVGVLAGGAGTLEEAIRAFEAALPYANELGLYAEEIDPASGAALGNFPQAFTHVGLVMSAVAIEERREREGRLQARRAPAPWMESQPWV